MSTSNVRERRDWRLPAKEPLPCVKKLSSSAVPDEDDFVIVEKPKDGVKSSELTELGDPKEKTPEATVEQAKSDKDSAIESQSSFVDMMLPVAARTKTENEANAFSTTLNAPLDFFASVVPSTSTEEVFRLLDSAWAENPSVTLRCIFHLRDVRNGKSDAFKFSDSLYWLYQKHPQTLIANLRHIPRTGYWKDLLNFLVRLVVGEQNYQEEVKRIQKCDQTKKSKKEEQEELKVKWKSVLEKAKTVWTEKPIDESRFRKRPVFALLYKKQLRADPDTNPLTDKPWSARSQKRRKWIHRTIQNIKNGVPPRDPEDVRKEQIARGQQNKLEAALLRHTKRSEQAVRACEIFEKDKIYRAVHIEIARLYAAALTKDVVKMKKCSSSPEEAKKRENFCSLASKWAPSLDGYHDKITHIATTITQILFKDELGSPQISTVEISRLRDRYRKEFITPLRKHIKVVESMLGYSLCHDIAYKTVPAVSMRRNRPLFEKLDAERFDQYLKDVKDGKTTIAASALKPHQLVRELLREHDYDYDSSIDSSDEESHSEESDSEESDDDKSKSSDDSNSKDGEIKDKKTDNVNGDKGKEESSDIEDSNAEKSGNESSSSEESDDDKSKDEREDEKRKCKKKKDKNAKLEAQAKKDQEDQLRELQWASYRDRLAKTGKLDRVMPIVDVSGSMSGEPMEVAIALGLLCAEVSKPPYNKLVCTFSEKPELFKVDQPTLRQKVHAMRRMNWGMNTNFEAVFDLILERALATKLPPEEMISLLIVFSDMEFDEARGSDGISDDSEESDDSDDSDDSKTDDGKSDDSKTDDGKSDDSKTYKKARSNKWTSLHDHIHNKFQKHGYNLPTIVYWNLRGGKRKGGTFPATEKQKGVALVSGFSGQMLKLFMDGDLDFDPIRLMDKALKRYDFVKVVD